MRRSPANPTPPMSNPLEVVEVQAKIISMQSETIKELFQLLAQHMAVEELDRLPCVERLNRAAALHSGIQPGEEWR